MDHTKYKDKGLTGLANLGNTCFINSCVQVLSHTYELNQFLDDGAYKKRLKKTFDSALLLEWDELRKLMWSENCIISPGKFIKTVQKLAQHKKMDLFTGYSQNDLPEFLLFIIDCFHSSLAREVNMNVSGKAVNNTDKMAVKCFETIKSMYKKDYSEIWNLFYGIHVSQITSIDKKDILSSSPEPFFMINLSIPSDVKNPCLKDCFDLYVKGEILEGDNAWYNEKTKQKHSVTKQIRYWSLPTILAIDLKRFNPVNPANKNQQLVNFPLIDMDLSSYVVGYNKSTYIYDLYAVCNHSGGVHGGHYTATIKNANGKWYNFNDTTVEEMKVPNTIISSKVYCLFYRKKTTK